MPGRSWNEPDIPELARLTVMVLSGAGEQPLKFNKLQDWIGENRGGNLTRSSPGGARGLDCAEWAGNQIVAGGTEHPERQAADLIGVNGGASRRHAGFTTRTNRRPSGPP